MEWDVIENRRDGWNEWRDEWKIEMKQEKFNTVLWCDLTLTAQKKKEHKRDCMQYVKLPSL